MCCEWKMVSKEKAYTGNIGGEGGRGQTFGWSCCIAGKKERMRQRKKKQDINQRRETNWRVGRDRTQGRDRSEMRRPADSQHDGAVLEHLVHGLFSSSQLIHWSTGLEKSLDYISVNFLFPKPVVKLLRSTALSALLKFKRNHLNILGDKCICFLG